MKLFKKIRMFFNIMKMDRLLTKAKEDNASEFDYEFNRLQMQDVNRRLDVLLKELNKDKKKA